MMAISREHLRQWMPILAERETPEACFERVLGVFAEAEQAPSAWRRIAFDHSGRIAGGCSLFSINRGLSMDASMHWWVSADAVGRGLGTELVAAALGHAIADLPHGLGLVTVRASIHPHNTASIALAEKVGFGRLGRSRQPVLVGDRWERHEHFEFRAPIEAQRETSEEAGGALCGVLVPARAPSPGLNIPASGWNVPSRATRS